MAIVVYKCNVCKREKQLIQNKSGLERISRCTITHGCRGSLYQTELLPDHVRREIPDPVDGLNDWFPRKVLHNHTQTIESDQWEIIHNMGTFPSVSVFVDRPSQDDLNNRDEIIPTDIIIIDENTIRLTFDRRWSGIAQLVARQSDPDLVDTDDVPQAGASDTAVQLTNNSELTIATLVNTFATEPILTFNITFQPSTGTPVTITYAVDSTPAVNSPWNDTNRVQVKGKIYTVRSFNPVPSLIGTVPTGSAFRFDQVDPTDDAVSSFQDIEKGQVLILLADQPFGNVDKNTREFIDVTSVTANTNTFSLFYDAPELFARRSIIQQVFPPIRTLD